MSYTGEDLLNYLYDFDINKNTLDDYNWLPSIRYRNIIAQTTNDLKQLTGHSIIIPAIVCHSGKHVSYLTNDPLFSIAYSGTMLKIFDRFFQLAAKSNGDFFAPTLHYPIGDKGLHKTLDIYTKRFNIYHSFALVRHCDDVTIVIAVANHCRINNIEESYNANVHTIENIAINMFDYLKDLFIEQLPGLKHTEFMKNKNFRNAVIKGNYKTPNFNAEQITPRECECLYWISKGKTSKEAAEIMNISAHTINEHKKSITKKMNTSNMSQAVYLAVKHQLII